MPSRFFKYIRRAFANRWNMLAFFGAAAFGVISGVPDVILPVVLAGELAYLGLLGSHEKFQRYVDAQEASAARKQGSAQAQQELARIYSALPRAARERFEALRSRCVELRQIALGLKGAAGGTEPLEDLQLAGLDRLLWIFLRLLFTQDALMRFLQRTDGDQIAREISRLESQLRPLSDHELDPQKQRMRKALEDNLATCRDRQLNLQKATDNLQLVVLELDRLENKIRSLSELAINRQEPEFISGQVDQVATSLLETEKTMNDLRFATGLETVDDAVPELLRPPPLPTAKKVTA